MAGAKQARTGARSSSGNRPAKGIPAKGTPAKVSSAKGAPVKGGPARGNGAGRPAAQNRPGPASKSVPQNRRARDRARAKELAQQSAADEPVAEGTPRWMQFTSLALAIFGLGVSIYLTIEHFTGNATLVCSDKGLVNCGAVTTSPQSMVFGVFPVAVLGLAYFVFMVPATTPWAWRARAYAREIAMVRLASVIVGVGFILYLIYVELYQVGAICLWCTSVHVATFLLFALVALSAAIWGLPKSIRSAR
jgi:uncharacterized membrane protein